MIGIVSKRNKFGAYPELKRVMPGRVAGMTERLRWPNTAEQARQTALGNANRGLLVLNNVLHGKCSGRTEEIRQVAIANDCLHRIRFELETVGPGKQKALTIGEDSQSRVQETPNGV